MEDGNFDIYGDLDEFLIETLQETNNKNNDEISYKFEHQKILQNENKNKITELTALNDRLKKNLSLLLVTAKSEINRKDQQIKDMQRRVDELIFRKNKKKKQTRDAVTQTEINLKLIKEDSFKESHTSRYIKISPEKRSDRDKSDNRYERKRMRSSERYRSDKEAKKNRNKSGMRNDDSTKRGRR
jgi:hypothetical protein